MKLNVVKLRFAWFLISGLTIGLSVVALAMWGLREGIEFTGGSLLALRFEHRPSAAELQSALDASKIELGSVVIQPVGDTDVQVRLKNLDEDQHQQVTKTVKEKFADATELRFDAIGPVIGEELRNKSVQGLVIALAAIMLYVAYVFRKVSVPVQSWKYGLVTIFTAFHDVIIPLGVFAYLGHYYHMEIGSAFVAAILTILGYSITDTIVVMDRIRENLQKHSGSFEEIVERSVHQTFLRSFNTSATTLLTLIAIFLFGGSTLHEFTLTLIIGIAVGTYSSIFVASPLLVSWNNWVHRKK
jgi:preprotein translocase subunit SecF